MSKHTPGPWTITNSREVFSKSTGDPICVVSWGFTPLDRQVAKADARLIAAAPDLLAALRGAALAIGDWSRPTGANGMTSPRPDDPLVLAMHAAYAAIDRAEGK